MDILSTLSGLVSIGAVLSFVLLIVGKMLPNEKVFGFGFKLGKTISSIGILKAGDNWEKFEDFLINSGGQFFSGIKNGLNSDDDDPSIGEPEKEQEKNVRT